MKNPFKDKETRDLIFISLGVLAVFAFAAWYKGGGKFDAVAGIFFGFLILLIIGCIAGVGAMFVRHFLDEKQTKIKNNYIKFVLTRLTFGGLLFLIGYLIFRVF